MRLTLIAALVAVPALAQQVYSWEDKDGVHYTDDPTQVPKGAKVASEKLAKRVVSPQPVQADVVAASAPTTAVAPSAASAKGPTNDERRWRDRFIEAYRRVDTLKQGVTALASSIPPETTCTTVLQPQGTMTAGGVTVTTGVGAMVPVQQCFPNLSRDRMVAELAQKRIELKDAELDIERLEREATMAQVPREWRRGW